jgi:hypothetical protein
MVGGSLRVLNIKHQKFKIQIQINVLYNLVKNKIK